MTGKTMVYSIKINCASTITSTVKYCKVTLLGTSIILVYLFIFNGDSQESTWVKFLMESKQLKINH